ncbi:hypothetical protein V5N11_025783 [Cardamine amara subsp. amara]|uniref:Glycine-rich protein n=1 Tax=Cardamine amara subsp. amara TaxID=228776 RepID=A0ABD1C8B0_CARAN
MNTKKFIVWSLLLAAIVVAVAAETSVDNKKEGAKQVETPSKDSLNQGDGVEATVENERDANYEVDQWRGGGGGWGGGGGPGGGWGGGGGPGGGWGGGGGGWRGGGGGWRGGGGGWRGGGGGGGWRGGGGGW